MANSSATSLAALPALPLPAPRFGHPGAAPGAATLIQRAERVGLAEHHADTPAVKLLRDTLLDAAARGASDIHLEPAERDWRIRLRIDGMLHEVSRPPTHLHDALVTRIKVLARLDIAERRTPQDGRLRLPLALGRVEEYRVNSLPTLYGEKLVLRRLDAQPTRLSLEALGLSELQQATLSAALTAPHGMLLVTGPTGSGKTVSLYCFLQMLNAVSLNLCSVEDPVEIQLAGVNQVSVRDKAGLTFASVLRAFLRQDPDVIMVGEIRDPETADVAVKAAQTGHRVLSTLHTNDAPATLARLLDIGVAPFNLASAVRLITAQRLLRKLCPSCRVAGTLSRQELLAAGFAAEESGRDWAAFTPGGCAACHGIGYRGRIGIHQVMPISGAMREIIVARGSARALARQARNEGVLSLRDAALASVRAGTTSLAEALAATEAPDAS
jgi:type IV pilus assembly protein PilB